MKQSIKLVAFLLSSFAIGACSAPKGVASLLSKAPNVNLSLPDDDGTGKTSSNALEVIVDKSKVNNDLLMNSSTNAGGETVIYEELASTTVTAKFVHKSEKQGIVDIEFIVKADAEFFEQDCYLLRLFPKLQVQDDTLQLSALYLTGEKYREMQNSQYEKFDKYDKSIVHDETEFRRNWFIDRFRERNIPEGLEVSGGSYGITLEDAQNHYIHRTKRAINRSRIENYDKKKERIVTCPIVTKNIQVDSVIKAGETALTYRYLYKLKSRPNLKKVNLWIEGDVYDKNRNVYSFHSPDTLTYYISSISSFIRDTKTTDPEYLKGLNELRNMDYANAVETLRPFKDFNSALAFLNTGYEYLAYRILDSLPKAGDVYFLKAIALIRLGSEDLALEAYRKACKLSPALISRGNLDPEISALKKKHNIDDMNL